MRRLLAFLAALAVGTALPACGGDSEPAIGVLLPMSGENATFGEESWNAIQIAYDEIQAKDSSFNLKLVLANEQSTKTVVGPQTKKLIENDGARIILGSVASSNTMETNRCGRTTALPPAASALDEEPSAALDATAEAVRVSGVSTLKEEIVCSFLLS